jgi:hypothetical protein
MPLPTDAQARKNMPVCRGVLWYFPDAIAAVAEVSRIGNEQHNPGEELHWARGKSMDQEDAIARHLIEAGEIDSDGVRHSAKLAWRALALLQLELETAAAPPGLDDQTAEHLNTRVAELRKHAPPKYTGNCPDCGAKESHLHDECCTWSAPATCNYLYNETGYCAKCGAAWNDGRRPNLCVVKPGNPGKGLALKPESFKS